MPSGAFLEGHLLVAAGYPVDENARSSRKREARAAPTRSSTIEPMNGTTQLPVRSTR
jgi:hypothetical protein